MFQLKPAPYLCVTLVCAMAFQAAAAPDTIVINEIHYNPDIKTEPAEFIELYNAGSNAVNLAGWQLSDGLDYTFAPTDVPPGGYVVVAQDPAFLATKFPGTVALGPLASDRTAQLSKYGDRITLRNAAGDTMDEVDYTIGFPWPTVGDPPGYSMELIHPSLDNNLGGSWRASTTAGSTPAPIPQPIFTLTNVWKFEQSGADLGAAWRQTNYDDTAWLSGPALLYVEESVNVAPKNTPLTLGRTNYYFRTRFQFTGDVARTSLRFSTLLDDGAVFYLNGAEFYRLGMPVGPVTAATLASRSVADAANEGPFTVPVTNLLAGENVLAVEVHQSAANSTDIVFGMTLAAVETVSGGTNRGPTPGRRNSVFALNAPPQIRQVEHTPEQPSAGQPVKITAKVTDPDGVASVVLEYQLVNPGSYIETTDAAYATNWVSLAMNDSGAAGDAAAGDDIYTAELPGSLQVHRRLVRYRLTVADSGGRSVRVPYADDPQPNFAYFCYNGVPGWSAAARPGTTPVINFSSNVMGRLPTFHLIAKSNSVAQATWFTRYGGDEYLWAGTLVYDGKVYDNIHYRARGGVWRYAMVKNMWKLDMNRGHDFEMRDNWGRKFKTPWAKINLGASIQQGDFWHRGEQGMFESIGFRLFNLAGVESPHTTFVTFRIIDDALEAGPSQYEGDFWGVYLALEQEDGRFLEEHDLPDGNLYKMEGGTGELNNTGPRGPANKADLNYFLSNYTGATEAWWRTNLNIPKYLSYQVIAQGIHHYDICYDKNFFYYLNPVTRLWEVHSWDLDLTWADNMFDSGCGGKDRIYQRMFDEANPSKANIFVEYRNRTREVRDLLFNSDEAWKLIDEYAALLRGPTNGPTLLDADRCQWDYNPKMVNNAYSSTLSKAQQGYFYAWQQQPTTISKDFNGTIQLMKNYVNRRGTNTLDVVATDNARPARPTLSYTGPTNYPINRLTFRSANYTGANLFASLRWRVGEITHTNSPSYNPNEPRKYEIETVWESGPVTTFNADITIPANVLRTGNRYRVRVQHADSTGRKSNWSQPHEFTCGEPEHAGDLLNYLRITEVMFNPPPGGYEFIELHNASSTATLDLAGVKFTQGIDFTFLPGTTLPPGSYLVVIGTTNIAAFRAYYGLEASVTVVAAYSGSLNNGGEQLTLRTAAGGTDIVSFNYKDGRGWPAAADGPGPSLVLVDSAEGAQGAGAGEYGGNWRASTFLRGSAGRADTAPSPTLVLNEIVAHTDFQNEFDSNDWLELYNTTDSPIALGPGWYLSDDGADLKKWMIPSNTVVTAHGWVSFDEQTGFHNPTNIGFGLSKDGEQVFLSYLPGTAADRVVDAVSFKAQENDWSLGRYPDGGAFWQALTPRTRDAANAAPLLHVDLSELMYHPPDPSGTNDNALDEFIELFNPTGSPVSLYNTNGGFRLDGGVSYNFATNTVLGGGEYLLVVNFDPTTNAAQLAVFKSLYGITDPTLVIVGPYANRLANNSDRVALEAPLAADGGADAVSWAIVDEVIYADQAPWPCGSDGTGNSLQRIAALSHGCDPANWIAEAPTAGRGRTSQSMGRPTIIAQPQDRIVPTNGNTSFSVSVCGAPPFSYQWQFNTMNIAGATNATLVLNNVQLSQAGSYTVLVTNPGGSTTSDPATLIVQFPPVITTHPQSQAVVAYTAVNFSVSAGGTLPLFYQWRFNGAPLPGTTNTTLVLTNVQPAQQGNYSVQVFNSAGSVVSSDAFLTVNVPATITSQPTNRIVGGNSNATFSVMAVGTGTLSYQWRFNGATIVDATNPTLLITNAQLTHSGNYQAVVTNAFGAATSQVATLTVLVKPIITQHPQSLTVLQGVGVTFSVAAVGTTPISFRWRKNNLTFTNALIVNTPSNSTLTITNAQPSDAATFNVAITNLAGQASGLTSNAVLIVLADFDGDGLADDWERTYGFATNNPADATLDADLDTSSNRDEYRAGTDPTNRFSYLKIDTIRADFAAHDVYRLTFLAVSNRTYTIQTRTDLSSGLWERMADVSAAPTNRVVEVQDSPPDDGARRYYRLIIP